MSRVRSRGNKTTELRAAELFKDNGITGWRRHAKLIGKPDFIWARSRVAVFIDGCFWHGCPIHYRKPVRNADFWQAKLDRNLSRDKLVDEQLDSLGWTVVRIWGHEIVEDLPAVVVRLRKIARQTGSVKIRANRLPAKKDISTFCRLAALNPLILL